MPRKPLDIARYDQGMAAADAALGRFLTGFRQQRAADGEPQAICNASLAFTMVPPDVITAIALAAIRRLAAAPAEDPHPAAPGGEWPC